MSSNDGIPASCEDSSDLQLDFDEISDNFNEVFKSPVDRARLFEAYRPECQYRDLVMLAFRK
jgi:hypothetical protein